MRRRGASLQVREEDLGNLRAHAAIPISFTVDRVLEITVLDGGLGGLVLAEQPVARPWVKDYDEFGGPGEWGERFDLSAWGLLGAHDGDQRVGGAVIARTTPGLHLLDDRDDLAVLWDLRVRPGWRGTGIGTALFGAVEDWARQRRCRELKIETQNINVPACRFYERRGCTLAAIDRAAYPALPGETQLVWRKDL